jgi:coenzyme F420-reducing hydrogenase alpha subunit
MLNSNDKTYLLGGQWENCSDESRQAILQRIEALIADAKQLLNIYPEVNFDNFYETGLLQVENLKDASKNWVNDVNAMFREIFMDNQSNIELGFVMIKGDDGYSEYAVVRSQLEKRVKLLNHFKGELETLPY